MARATTTRTEPKAEVQEEVKAVKPETKSELTPDNPLYWEEKEEYIHPKDLSAQGDDSIVVSVNGDSIRIKPGHKVFIKRKFIEVLKGSLHAQYEKAEEEAKHAYS